MSFEGIFKTVFLVAVDVEMLLEVAGRIGDGLVGEVNHHVHLRISLDVGKELLKKGSLTTTGRTKLLSSFCLWISAKKPLTIDAETVPPNGSGGHVRGSSTRNRKVLPRHEDGA